jgi:hypothetical protein
MQVAFDANQAVSTVKVEYPTSAQSVKDHEASASAVLRNSLSIPPGHSNITLTLDKFSKNLDRLAQLDKLNGPPTAQTFNCFDAIAGVYASLRKLYEHEKKAAMVLLKQTTDVEEAAEREVLCKKSGRPIMNSRDEIGLKLDYWMQRRHVLSKHLRRKSSPNSDKDHDMDSDPPSELAASDVDDMFSLTIECEASVPEMYPPARVSTAWISDQIEKSPDDLEHAFGPVLDWLDPLPTYLSRSEESQTNGMALNGAMEKLPSIRFVAKMDPPLLLPLNTAVQLLGPLGVSQESLMHPELVSTFDSLLLHPNGPDATNSMSLNPAKKESRIDRTVLVPDSEEVEKSVRHSNSLFVPRAEYARYIREFPFDHPRQLIELLPVSLCTLVSRI